MDNKTYQEIKDLQEQLIQALRDQIAEYQNVAEIREELQKMQETS